MEMIMKMIKELDNQGRLVLPKNRE